MSDQERPAKRHRPSPQPSRSAPVSQAYQNQNQNQDPISSRLNHDHLLSQMEPRSVSPQPAPSVFYPLQPPDGYTPAAGVGSTQVGLPTHLTSFSYSPERDLLLDTHRQDEALQHYRPPIMGADLNRGFESCEWGKGRPDEGLDGLLRRSVAHTT